MVDILQVMEQFHQVVKVNVILDIIALRVQIHQNNIPVGIILCIVHVVVMNHVVYITDSTVILQVIQQVLIAIGIQI